MASAWLKRKFPGAFRQSGELFWLYKDYYGRLTGVVGLVGVWRSGVAGV